MKIQVEQKDGISQLQIQGEMTIYSAMELKPNLIDTLQKSQEMVINLSGVNEIDCSGLQLLISIKRKALKAGKTLRLIQHSPVVLEAIDALNLLAYFSAPPLVPTKSA